MGKQNRQLPKPKMGKFIDPLTDFGFKHLFGSEPSKELLIDFLNEIFKGRKVITNLTYNKNERPGPICKSRKMILILPAQGRMGNNLLLRFSAFTSNILKTGRCIIVRG